MNTVVNLMSMLWCSATTLWRKLMRLVYLNIRIDNVAIAVNVYWRIETYEPFLLIEFILMR